MSVFMFSPISEKEGRRGRCWRAEHLRIGLQCYGTFRRDRLQLSGLSGLFAWSG